MTVRNIVLIPALILGLAGCAAGGGDAGLGAADAGPAPSGGGGGRYLLAWEGATVSELEQSLGRPEAVNKLASGETVMTYKWSQTQTYGGYAVPNGGYSQLGTQYVP